MQPNVNVIVATVHSCVEVVGFHVSVQVELILRGAVAMATPLQYNEPVEGSV
jgi:hypothetical protein